MQYPFQGFPRTITLTGLLSMNAVNFSPSNILVASFFHRFPMLSGEKA
jgi:hypothetical protein